MLGSGERPEDQVNKWLSTLGTAPHHIAATDEGTRSVRLHPTGRGSRNS